MCVSIKGHWKIDAWKQLTIVYLVEVYKSKTKIHNLKQFGDQLWKINLSIRFPYLIIIISRIKVNMIHVFPTTTAYEDNKVDLFNRDRTKAMEKNPAEIIEDFNIKPDQILHTRHGNLRYAEEIGVVYTNELSKRKTIALINVFVNTVGL